MEINTLEQKSNVDEYVNKILDIFGEQENKINAMKQKLLGFKRLLKEENELSKHNTLITFSKNLVVFLSIFSISLLNSSSKFFNNSN